jgi:transcriptional regulator GlxA family with amidase domain
MPAPRDIAFVTLPNFSMIALTNALEACRMANYVAGRELYRWHVATADGQPAMASNGLALTPTVPLDSLPDIDMLLVCGGIDVRHATSRPLKTQLRRYARRGIILGALCTGSFALAEAGLLDGYRCAIHWENLASIREEFPEIDFVENLFVIDRDRITCTGGIAPLDLMLTLIEARLGTKLAGQVREQFIVNITRPAEQRQPTGAPRHPVLSKVWTIMEETIAAPLSVREIAERAGLSPRQLERLFLAHLKIGPAEFYSGLRLDRARQLLRQTPLSVTEVALACGFQSPSHFSTRYSARFGCTPRTDQHRVRLDFAGKEES